MLDGHRLSDSPLARAVRGDRLRHAILTLALGALAFAPPAHALLGAGASTIDRAAQALAQSPVYVDYRSADILSAGDAQRVKNEIVAKETGPMYIAVLPASAADAAGGDPDSVLREIEQELRRPGTYAAFVGEQFRAGAVGAILPKGDAHRLAKLAVGANRSEGAASTLLDFVDRVGAARNGGGHSGGRRGLLLLAVLAVVGGVVALVRRRYRGTATPNA